MGPAASLRLRAYLDALPERRGLAFPLHFLAVFAATWSGAQALGYAIAAVCPGPSSFDPRMLTRSGLIFGVLLSPILETLAMRGLFWLLRRLRRGPGVLLGWSTLFWWVGHLPTESWGLPAAGAFWVMGALYLAFERRSTDQALVAVAAFHVAFNAFAFLLLHGRG